MAPDEQQQIAAALCDALPDDGLPLVRRVEVAKGFGDIHFVKVHSGLRRRDASPSFEATVRSIVARIFDGRRHHVTVHWADSF